jgi:serine/threonine protein kinase
VSLDPTLDYQDQTCPTVKSRLLPWMWVPRKMGRYQICGLLKRGGMSHVFAAEYVGENGFRSEVAIKVGREAVVREGRLLSSFHHPNIVSVFDAGRDGGLEYLALERIEGGSLLELRREVGALPPVVVLDLAIQLCEALAALQQIKPAVVHADLKPANVMVTREGQLKLIDFGIATVAGNEPSNSSYGTAAYMSPEAVCGDTLDGRTDLFGVGLLLFEMLTGQRLFDERDPFLLMRERTKEALYLDRDKIIAAVAPFCPALGPVIVRCLRASPRSRYPSAVVLGERLSQLRPVVSGSVGAFWRQRVRGAA